MEDDNKLEQIRANYSDDTFNSKNQKKAEKEGNALFGTEAKKSFHAVSVWYIKTLGFVVLGIVVAVLLVRSWHLLAPEKYQWLTAEAINKIDHILVGIIAGLSVRFFPKSNPAKDE